MLRGELQSDEADPLSFYRRGFEFRVDGVVRARLVWAGEPEALSVFFVPYDVETLAGEEGMVTDCLYGGGNHKRADARCALHWLGGGEHVLQMSQVMVKHQGGNRIIMKIYPAAEEMMRGGMNGKPGQDRVLMVCLKALSLVLGVLMGSFYFIAAQKLTKDREPWMTVVLGSSLAVTMIGLGHLGGLPVGWLISLWAIGLVVLLMARMAGARQKARMSVEVFGMVHLVVLMMLLTSLALWK